MKTIRDPINIDTKTFTKDTTIANRPTMITTTAMATIDNRQQSVPRNLRIYHRLTPHPADIYYTHHVLHMSLCVVHMCFLSPLVAYVTIYIPNIYTSYIHLCLYIYVLLLVILLIILLLLLLLLLPLVIIIIQYILPLLYLCSLLISHTSRYYYLYYIIYYVLINVLLSIHYLPYIGLSHIYHPTCT